MKTFKHSLLAISLAFCSTVSSLACGWDGDDPSHYNLFRCVPEIPDAHEDRINESVQFWINYLGGPDKVGADIASGVDYMRPYHFEDDNEDNDLVTILRRSGDTQALEFLRLNMQLNDLISFREWEYRRPSAEEISAVLNDVERLKTTGELTRRKTFLKMRCLYALGDYQACQRLWDSFASKWEPSPLRDRFEGYMAGIQFQKGNYAEALPIYFKQGDGESVKICVNRMLDASSMEREYQKDPDALILSYILQDYANYFYHASYDDFWEGAEGYDIWSRVTSERDNIIRFAEKVVKDGKAKDLQMWQAFIGFVQMTSHQNGAAYESFCKAESLRGNGVVKSVLRDYKFCASMGMLDKHPKGKGLDKYIVEELEHYRDVCNNSAVSNDAERNVLSGLYGDILTKRLEQYLNQKGDPIFTFLVMSEAQPYYYYCMDRNCDTDQTIALREVILSGGKGNALYGRLISGSNLYRNQDDHLNELVGTKLMRDDRFEEAQTYLQQVSNNYIAHQGITPYLMQRPLQPQIPFRRLQYEECYGEYEADEVVNGKLNFCQLILSYKEQYKHADNDEQRAEACYNLGLELFHGSASGDLWAISQYSHSSYMDDFNEFNLHAIKYLQQALSLTKSTFLKGLCYYGLAATPDNQSPNYLMTDVIVTYSDSRTTAYNKIRELPASHPVFGYCDWLGFYAQTESE